MQDHFMTQVHDRIVRDPECEEISGLSRTTRWRLEQKGLFPRRRRISPNGVGWLLSEINEWVSKRAIITLNTCIAVLVAVMALVWAAPLQAMAVALGL